MPHYQTVDLLLLAFALVVMPVWSAWMGARVRRSAGDSDLLRRYRIIIVRGGIVSLVLVASWMWLGRPFAALGLGAIGWRGALGFAVVAFLAVNLVQVLRMRSLSPEKTELLRRQLDASRIIPHTDREFAWFPWVCVTGSIAEELLYRGFLLWALAPVAGIWGAVLISSAAFGFAHAYQGGKGIVRTGAIGLVFAIGFALTHSLWWLIGAHILMNLSGYIYARKLRAMSPVIARSRPSTAPCP